MRTYVTFGQIHTHRINNNTIDKDCVVVLDENSDKAYELFGSKFSQFYSEEDWSEDNMVYYPRGYIYVK